MTVVTFFRLPHGAGLPLPTYARSGDAGLDLRAATWGASIPAGGGRRLIATGFAVELPPGFEGQIRPRSGLALKHGVTVLNSPGTIDQSYRGEIGVILINHGSEPFMVSRGDRIAQLVIAPVATVVAVEAAELTASERGSGGFGSTGV